MSEQKYSDFSLKVIRLLTFIPIKSKEYIFTLIKILCLKILIIQIFVVSIDDFSFYSIQTMEFGHGFQLMVKSGNGKRIKMIISKVVPQWL